MANKRIYELAKELNVSSKELLTKASAKGMSFNNHMATISDAQEKTLRGIIKPTVQAKAANAAANEKSGDTAPKRKVVHHLINNNKKSDRRHTNFGRNGANLHGEGRIMNLSNPRTNNRQTKRQQEQQSTAPRSQASASQTATSTAAKATSQAVQSTATSVTASSAVKSTTPRSQAAAKTTATSHAPRSAAAHTTSRPTQSRPAARNTDQRNGGNNSSRNNNNNHTTANRNGSTNSSHSNGRSGGYNSNNNRNGSNTNNGSRDNNRSYGSRNNNGSNNSGNSNNRNSTNSRNTSSRTSSRPTANAGASSSNTNSNGSGRNNRFSNSSNGNRFGNNNRRGGRGQQQYGQKHQKRNKRNQRIKQTAQAQPAPTRKERPLPDVLMYDVGMNAQDLSKILHRETAEIVKKLFMLGVMVNQNQSLDKDTIEILAADYGIEAQEKPKEDIADIDKFFEEQSTTDPTKLVPRPPVVTIMGHVDHGKTTLLDQLRNSHITAGEAGGITQKIGAYQVELKGRKITFIDTPGHAAFTAMRARGADITDITILVVAADDGVMPQTIEAIHHAQAAKTPIIVAVNKIDKPGANPNHVIEQLSAYNLIPEDWGGDTIFVEISAKYDKNLDELLDMILLQADLMELKADPEQRALGSVIEARLDKGRGPVATVLVQEGTLEVGDPIVIGNTYGRIRTMNNDRGRTVKEATPATPVEITGMNDVPEAGDKFVVFEDEKSARAAGEERAKRALVEERSHANHVTLDNLFDTMKEGEMKEVDVIIKADVQGSVEALATSFQKIQVDGVRVNIIHQAVGAINESDVTLAEASNAIIVGFNVRPTAQAKSQADSDGVDIRLHNVIYNAIDEIESAMKGMLEPVYKEEVTGQVEVRELYKVSKVGTVVGGMVTEGYISSDAGVRLVRDGVVVYEGKLGSLQRFKDQVKQVKAGFDLGLTIAGYNDIKVGDVIEAFVMKEVPVE
ncbi:MAG: translation initiation factor IF-2 [Furfurilactobacillus sp.]|jgi:translation initiation factor IF-2|uniref:Translation initiation factor IF-2 n=1 Tax=Furfurilactobacillus milii TaxID=2888272 RepID=A0ABT6D715_9LACO|nr:MULTISPECIES: translation initiation factor IF-2 [Furfurilactobacillus]QLE66457.1 Translation initiation factor 2 [Furfurilactobacillus rossiae]MCF6159913.1 translation initiation factor IF-2 [Furfurilactobacillus milii]MCF6162538.1 translation initiation factor IF-2 [Furfurilactobacillus milii]MCF6419291.1 translation initiation factor IF-2 [Furfurilactobacillus milii]MCH4010833.1 translation initiation factor IF-2 [Furfurilactobacillus sp.]